jgi:hypothetical protein
VRLARAAIRANLKLQPVLVSVNLISSRDNNLTNLITLALSYVEPDHGYIGGGETVVIYGGPFPSLGDSGEALIYTCVFANDAGPGTPSEDGKSSIALYANKVNLWLGTSLECTTPSSGNLIGNVSLTVNVGAQSYIPWDALNFLFYGKLQTTRAFHSL